MTEKTFQKKLHRIEQRNDTLLKKQMLKQEREKYKPKQNIKLPSMSKIVLLVSALFCAEIVIFSEYAIMALGSGESLYTLIGAPITIVPIVIAYYSKSKAENTRGGLVYDMAMTQQEDGSDDFDEIIESSTEFTDIDDLEDEDDEVK